MSIFDKLEKAVKGFGGALQAPLGLVKDLAQAPFSKDDRDSEFNGFFETVLGYGMERTQQTLGGAGQALSAVGDIITPDPLGDRLRPVGRGLSRGSEAVYREAVSQPIARSTLALGRAADNRFERGLAAIYGPMSFAVPGLGLAIHGASKAGLGPSDDDFEQAAKQAEHTSPGQASVYGLFNIDVRDPDAIARVRKTVNFQALSGVFDAGLRLELDPSVVGGKLGAAARVKYVTKPLTGRDDLERVMGSNRIAKVKTAMEGKSAAEIRDRFFPNTPNGGALSSALAEADDAGRDRILRLAMGDREQLHALWSERADLAGRVERALGEQDDVLAALDPGNFARVNGFGASLLAKGPPRKLSTEADDAFAGGIAAVEHELARSKAEIDTLYDKADRNFRDENIMGVLRTQPRASILDAKRVALTRSTLYQESLFAAPLRTVFNVKPDRMVRVEEPDGDINVVRYMKKTGLDQDAQDAWRNRYMAQADPESRAKVLVEMEDTAVATMAQRAGITTDELTTIMREINRGRDDAGKVLAGRVFDGEGRSRVTFKDDKNGEVVEIPLLVPQTANLVPLADLDAARKALTRIGEIRRNNPAAQIPAELLDAFHSVWKPAMLLRVGWTARSLVDANLRMLAKVGAAATLQHIKPGVENTMGNLYSRTLASIENGGTTAERRLAAQDAEVQGVGFGTEKIRGYQVESAFGPDRRTPIADFNLTSSGQSFNELIGQAERLADEKLRKATGDWRSLDPVKHAQDYDKAWLRDVNEQIGRDLIARQFLEGKTLDEVERWTKTLEGRQHLRRLPPQRRRDVTNTLGLIQEQVESYTLGNPAIKAAALKQRATVAQLDEATTGHRPSRPVIHGEVLADVVGTSPLGHIIGEFVTGAYKALGTIPEDTLARHPFYATMYNNETARLVDVLSGQRGGRLNADELGLIKTKARAYALDETRKTFYDAAEKSDFAGMLKFLSPFYSSWQDAWTTWAGIAVENPAFVARMKMAWESPERAGLVVDENGNEVGPDSRRGDTVKYADGTTSKIGKERFVRLPLPPGVGRIVGLKGLESQGEVLFSKKSANFIFQASPGFGPVVSIPVAQIVRDNPTLTEATKFILPYGAGENMLDTMLPSTARRALQANRGEDDRVFRNVALRILTDEITNFRTGKRKDMPTWNEASTKAGQLASIRTFAAYVMPVLPGFKSPYQPYLDKYRRLRAMDPKNAEMRFLDEEGPEFFALTQSFSKSADGVPPTLEAYKARQEFKDLIEASPDLGRLIIGEESAAGAFVSSVYRSQLENNVSRTSNDKQRGALSVEEVAAGPNVRQGWIEFRRAMDFIEAARIDRKLPNLRVKEAADLADLKKQTIDALGQRFPEWFAKFSVVDRGAAQRELDGLKKIAADPRLAQRPDIAGLGEYLKVRGYFQQMLQYRDSQGGSGTLDASGNADIAEAWETVRGSLAEKNPAFATVMYRFLDRDDLKAA